MPRHCWFGFNKGILLQHQTFCSSNIKFRQNCNKHEKEQLTHQWIQTWVYNSLLNHVT